MNDKNTGQFAMLNLTVNSQKAYEILDLDRILVTDDPKCLYFRLQRKCDIASQFYLYSDKNIIDLVKCVKFIISNTWSYEIDVENIFNPIHPSILMFPIKLALLAIPMLYNLIGDMTVYFEITLKDPYIPGTPIGMRYKGEFYPTKSRREIVEHPEKYVGLLMDITRYLTLDNLCTLVNNKVVKRIEIYDPTDDIFSVTFGFNVGQDVQMTFTKHDSIVDQYTRNEQVKEDVFVINPELWSFHKLNLSNVIAKSITGELLDLSKYKVALITTSAVKYQDGMISIKE